MTKKIDLPEFNLSISNSDRFEAKLKDPKWHNGLTDSARLEKIRFFHFFVLWSFLQNDFNVHIRGMGALPGFVDRKSYRLFLEKDHSPANEFYFGFVKSKKLDLVFEDYVHEKDRYGIQFRLTIPQEGKKRNNSMICFYHLCEDLICIEKRVYK